MNKDKIKAILAEMREELEDEAYFDEDVIFDENGEIEDEMGGYVVSRDSMAEFARRIEEALEEGAQ